MKPVKIFLVYIVGLFALVSCKGDPEVYQTYPDPNWTVDLSGKLPLSMSAVIVLPDYVNPYTTENDRLAAFIGDECRGIGQLINTGEQRVYFILIKGDGSEQKKISFRYYNARNAYLYTTNAFLPFEIDTRYGSVDAPELLTLNVVNE